MLDAIVVGGGVAGSQIASKLNGDVMLLEKNRKVLPKDSGIVSTRVNEIFPRERNLIKHEIDKMECISPSGKTFWLKSSGPFAYILRRRRFGRFLLKNAAKNAAVRREMVQSVSFEEDHVVVNTNKASHEARMVIGCDGSVSAVRKSMGIDNPKLALGMMVKTRQKMEGDIAVHFNKYFSPDFFSWIIPANREYGMMTTIRPKEYFDYFRKNMFLPPGSLYAYMIPYTYTKSYAERAMLVGDACGQNKPLTGGGIIFSLLATRHAIQMANDAIEQKRFDAHFLSFYERYWKKELAWEIEKQFLIRSVYRKMTNKEIDGMFDKVGKQIEALPSFDYDKFSVSFSTMPKLKIIATLLRFLPRMII